MPKYYWKKYIFYSVSLANLSFVFLSFYFHYSDYSFRLSLQMKGFSTQILLAGRNDIPSKSLSCR